MEAEYPPEPYGHVRVAGEVEEELQREGEGADPRRHCGERCRILTESQIRNLAEGIGYKGLLAEPDNEAPDAVRSVICRGLPFPELFGNLVVLDDWARDELREERYVEGDSVDIFLGFHSTAPYVDCVGDGLEGIEGNSERQDDAERAYVSAGDKADVRDDEVKVLECREDGDESAHSKESEQVLQPHGAFFRRG